MSETHTHHHFHPMKVIHLIRYEDDAAVIAQLHALARKSRLNAWRMRHALAIITQQPFCEGDFPMATNPPANIDAAILELNATEAEENAAAKALVDFVATVPQLIADAADAASKLGATPEQLRSFQTLNTNMAAAAASMKAALAAPPTP